jgi:hypothetical protein
MQITGYEGISGKLSGVLHHPQLTSDRMIEKTVHRLHDTTPLTFNFYTFGNVREIIQDYLSVLAEEVMDEGDVSVDRGDNQELGYCAP